MQDPETGAGGAEADLGDDIDIESEVSEVSEVYDSARVQDAVPEALADEFATGYEPTVSRWGLQRQMYCRDDWAPVRDIPPELMSCSILTVPFQSAIDADMACRYLGTMADSLRGEVYNNLSVNDKDVILVLRATDNGLLQRSMDSLLSSLSRMLYNLKDLISPLRHYPVVTKYWQND